MVSKKLMKSTKKAQKEFKKNKKHKNVTRAVEYNEDVYELIDYIISIINEQIKYVKSCDEGTSTNSIIVTLKDKGKKIQWHWSPEAYAFYVGYLDSIWNSNFIASLDLDRNETYLWELDIELNCFRKLKVNVDYERYKDYIKAGKSVLGWK